MVLCLIAVTPWVTKLAVKFVCVQALMSAIYQCVEFMKEVSMSKNNTINRVYNKLMHNKEVLLLAVTFGVSAVVDGAAWATALLATPG